MKNLYIITTLIFWLAIVFFWLARSWLPISHDVIYSDSVTVYSLSVVAKHNKRTDCWMAIHGQVYDLTAYLPQHPAALRVILPSCGAEASLAYDTKNRSKEHSDTADTLLKQYEIGILSH